jgi:hypothetical protein
MHRDPSDQAPFLGCLFYSWTEASVTDGLIGNSLERPIAAHRPNVGASPS